MGRRPLDRRSFRDECAAERSQMSRPESVPQDINLGEVVVGWLAWSCVLRRTEYLAFSFWLCGEDRSKFEYSVSAIARQVLAGASFPRLYYVKVVLTRIRDHSGQISFRLFTVVALMALLRSHWSSAQSPGPDVIQLDLLRLHSTARW